jgi:hypothetical protein
MGRIRMIEQPHNLEFRLVSIVHKKFTLRRAQAQFDASKTMIHNDNASVPKEAELIRGRFHAAFLQVASGTATFDPYHFGQIW